MTSQPSVPDLDTLIALFYRDAGQLGEFSEVPPEAMPEPARQLLAHNRHMTVTVEAFHASPVDVEVLQTDLQSPHYSRKILLRRQSDGGVVQFGIVRLNVNCVGKEVREEILAEQTPLGRVLINHQVLREVQLHTLWKITAGPDLAKMLKVPLGAVVYGRTALIYCNGEPAVELLEVVN